MPTIEYGSVTRVPTLVEIQSVHRNSNKAVCVAYVCLGAKLIRLPASSSKHRARSRHIGYGKYLRSQRCRPQAETIKSRSSRAGTRSTRTLQLQLNTTCRHRLRLIQPNTTFARRLRPWGTSWNSQGYGTSTPPGCELVDGLADHTASRVRAQLCSWSSRRSHLITSSTGSGRSTGHAFHGEWSAVPYIFW